MLVLAWLLSLAAAGYLGYHYRGLAEKVKTLQTTFANNVSKKPEPEQRSLIIDPSDIAQQAKYERDQLIDKLNP